MVPPPCGVPTTRWGRYDSPGFFIDGFPSVYRRGAHGAATFSIMKLVACLLIAGCTGGLAVADDDAVRRCRLVVETTARLACYDAIAIPVRGGPAARTGQPEPSSTNPAAGFGLENRLTPAQEIETLDGVIPGRFDGWIARGKFSLANGQVWEISDGSQAAYNLRDPKVRITRGMAGTFFMQIEGVSQTPRVRRVQ